LNAHDSDVQSGMDWLAFMRTIPLTMR
jgi:hypothetical protein